MPRRTFLQTCSRVTKRTWRAYPYMDAKPPVQSRDIEAAAFRIRRLYKDPGAGERIGHAADDGYAATTAWKALAGISHV